MAGWCVYRILTALFASLEWSNVVIICQHETCGFLQHNEELSVPFQLYGGLNESTLSSVLGTVASGGTQYLVVEGDEKFLTLLLRRANIQDRLSGQHDILIHRFEWIIIHRPSPVLGSAVSNLTNVLMLHHTELAGTCQGVVETAMWGDAGRWFSPVATWTDADGLTVSSALFPNKEFGLNGRHLVIGTNVWAPFVGMNTSAEPVFTGFCPHLTAILASDLNFTYTLMLPPDGKWGAKDGNGTWNGLMGMLYTRDADLVIAPFSSTFERRLDVDFADTPLFNEMTVILYKKPHSDDYLITIFYRPLGVPVWACYGCSLLVVTLAQWVVRRFSLTETTIRAQLCFVQVFAAIVNQGNDQRLLPKHWSGRIIMYAWYLAILVLWATYSGNLVAFLTVSKNTVPINTLEDLADQDQYKFGLLGGTAWVTSFESSRNPVYHKIWRKINEWRSPDLDTLSYDLSYHVHKTNVTKYAHIMESLPAQKVLQSDPNYVIAKERFFPMRYSVALQKNSAHTDRINEAMQDLHEIGIMRYLEKTYMPSPHMTSPVQRNTSISLKHIQGIFIMLFVGVLLSAVLVLLETCYWNIKTYSKKVGYL